MGRTAKRWNRLVLALVGFGMALTACRGYDVNVTVAPDGSGTRTLMLNTDIKSPDDPQLLQMAELFDLTEARGWKRIDPAPVEAERTGVAAPFSALNEQESVVFERRTKAKNAQGWDRSSGDIHILGRALAGPGTPVAGPRADQDVEFQNVVALEVGTQAGRSTVTYRERFAWTGLLEWLTAHSAERFAQVLKESYPFLTDPDLAEMRGYVAGQLTAAIVGRKPKDNLNVMLEPLAGPLEDYTRRVILRRRPDADVGGLRARCESLLDGEGDELETSLATELPGVDLAVLASIDLKVTLPGPVVDSNADETDGNVAIWHIDLWDALGQPIEAYARADAGGE